MKTIITINVLKIPKDKLVERTYENKLGQTIIEKNFTFELQDLKEKTFIKEGENWRMLKTHFASLPKENKDDQTIYIGSGIQFEQKDTTSGGFNGEKAIAVDSIPF